MIHVNWFSEINCQGCSLEATLKNYIVSKLWMKNNYMHAMLWKNNPVLITLLAEETEEDKWTC